MPAAASEVIGLAGGDLPVNELTLLAYHHTAGWTDWLAHVTISSIFHGLIYGFMFKLMRQMALLQKLR